MSDFRINNDIVKITNNGSIYLRDQMTEQKKEVFSQADLQAVSQNTQAPQEARILAGIIAQKFQLFAAIDKDDKSLSTKDLGYLSLPKQEKYTRGLFGARLESEYPEFSNQIDQAKLAMAQQALIQDINKEVADRYQLQHSMIPSVEISALEIFTVGEKQYYIGAAEVNVQVNPYGDERKRVIRLDIIDLKNKTAVRPLQIWLEFDNKTTANEFTTQIQDIALLPQENRLPLVLIYTDAVAGSSLTNGFLLTVDPNTVDPAKTNDPNKPLNGIIPKPFLRTQRGNGNVFGITAIDQNNIIILQNDRNEGLKFSQAKPGENCIELTGLNQAIQHFSNDPDSAFYNVATRINVLALTNDKQFVYVYANENIAQGRHFVMSIPLVDGFVNVKEATVHFLSSQLDINGIPGIGLGCDQGKLFRYTPMENELSQGLLSNFVLPTDPDTEKK